MKRKIKQPIKAGETFNICPDHHFYDQEEVKIKKRKIKMYGLKMDKKTFQQLHLTLTIMFLSASALLYFVGLGYTALATLFVALVVLAHTDIFDDSVDTETYDG